MVSQRHTISIILLLTVISPAICSEPALKASVNSVTCFGADDGRMVLELKNINTPYTLMIVKEANADTLFATVSEDTDLEYKHLTAGNILIRLLEDAEVITEARVEITEPEPLLAGRIKIDKVPASEASCDGVLSVSPEGGNPPYTYRWSENAGSISEPSVSNVCMGIYRCEINDSKNCGPVYISVPLVKNALKKTE